MSETPHSVLKFWFDELEPKDHFTKSDTLDATIQGRFLAVHGMLASELAGAELPTDHLWMENAENALAAIIVLDQFSRNMFRDTPASFASDTLALQIAKTSIAKGWDTQIEIGRRSFVYMPFMHAENLSDQSRCVDLFKTLEGENSEEYAVRHKVIIERFGRFPHRNAILGRLSTPEEVAFLTEPNSSF